MSSRTALLDVGPEHDTTVTPVVDASPAVVLKGGKGGLEIVIGPAAIAAGDAAAIGEALTDLLSEAPGFFAGSQARVRFEGRLPAGALGLLETVAARFDLSIVEVGPPPRAARVPAATAPPPVLADEVAPASADGSGPVTPAAVPVAATAVTPATPVTDDGVLLDFGAAAAAPAVAHLAAYGAAVDEIGPGARLFVGPVRSGSVLEARGHLVILGDVNPGAEVRAEGNILVLGRLRGVAHAAIGGEVGFILALRLEPQQLRIGRLVARAGADDSPGDGIELAYATGKTIVVERYQGRLPSGLAASL